MYQGIDYGKRNWPIYFAMIIPIFTGIGGGIQTLVTLAELVIMIYYFYSDKFWLLTPIYYVYYSQLLLYGDRVAFFSIYSFLLIFRMVYKERYIEKNKVTLDIKLLFCLLLFSAIVITINISIWSGVLLATQSIALLYSLITLRNNEYLLKWFKVNFVIMALSAALYGIIFMNIKGIYEEQGTLIQYGGRYSGTTADPNYMAFYYCVAFSFLLFMQMKNSWYKRMGIVLLFLAIALTGSLTALVTIFTILVLYIICDAELSKKTKLINIILLSIAVICFFSIMTSSTVDVPVLNVFKYRIDEKIGYLKAGNYLDATSGRTNYSMRYVEYLFNQNIARILFGGYQLNALGLIGEAFSQIRFAAHNSYVDVLMTNGIVGLILLFCSICYKVYRSYHLWRVERKACYLTELVNTIVVAVFMFCLSMYPSPAYMIFLLI